MILNLKSVVVLGVVGLTMATATNAQVRPAPAATAEQLEARRQISALEGVLESAVTYGAQMLTQHVQTSNVPDMVMLTGMARARGFRLDGYGVVVDVEFPSIRRSVMWSMRALRPDKELLGTLREIRKSIDPRDVAARQAFDREISELEAQIKATDQQMKGSASTQGVTATSGTAGVSGPGPTLMPDAAGDPKNDVKALYFNEITGALMDALLEHGSRVNVGADEWVTVAARESADRGFSATDPNDTAMTFVLRVKGSDLQAIRERRLTKEEARRRVWVSTQ